VAGPGRKEELMNTIRQHSIRRKSKVLGIRRQTYHDRKRGNRPEEKDQQIAQELHQTVNRFVAWGFWLVFYFLRSQGMKWNHKKVYRIWKQEQLHLRRKPKRSKIRRDYLDLLAPNGINEGWAMDFVSDWVVGPEDKKIRVINIMDERSRRALWTEAYFSITAKTLTKVLDQVIAWRGKPAYIRCDNGPEFIAEHLLNWAKNKGINILHIQPGKPSQNGLMERLNGTLRTECLNLHWFKNLELLNEAIQEWWHTYNELRPHSSIKFLTPKDFETKHKELYFSMVAA
jgi:putative transposase